MEADGGLDRISELPDDLLYYVLSFLTMDESIRTSVLSTRWNNIWNTLPYLKFYVHGCRPTYDQYLQFIHIILDKYENNDYIIQRFCLTVDVFSNQLVQFVDTLVSGLDRYKINEFHLDISRSRFEPKKCFPHHNILRLKSIVMLSLTGCKLCPLSDFDQIELVSLRNLSLRRVLVDELLLEKFLASCQRLEKFSLKYSMPLRNIKVTGLMALTNVELCSEDHTSVEIDGPSLLCLKIERCNNLKSLLISSNSLISLELSDYTSKTKAGFTIPNLQNLKLHCTKRFAISTNALPRMKAEFHLKLDRFGPTAYFDLLNLLIELNRSESVTLLINLPNKAIPEKWKTRFAGMEHLSQFQSIWLGTNIGLMDGLRKSFPNHRILHDSVWKAYVREEDDWGY